MAKLKWICTDPDSNQYGRIVPGKEGVYEFKQDHIKEQIDLGEWKLKEVDKILKAYGYTVLKGKKGEYIFDTQEDPGFLIAECIFESTVL